MSQPPALTKATSNSIKASASSAQLSPAASRAEQFFSTTSGGRYSTPAGRGSQQQQQQQQATPRSNQTGKPKHKTGKKYQSEGLLDDDERLAMQNIGRRGKGAMDITHLMNIALPPRPQQGQYHRHSYNGPRQAGARGTPSWMGSGYHAVDKARYIHANYRFIVTPQGDYSAQAADADVHIDWASVLQIVASPLSQHASCPICLGEPVAPRMPKCGHIFCMPCLIRYMHSDSDNARPGHEKRARWKRCPICEDTIYVSETRPVRWYAGQEIETLREGTDVVLRLVKRKAGSTLAMPRESTDVVPKGEMIPWYFAAEVMDYARVMKGSEEYMLQQYDEAIVAIQQLEREDELMFGEDAEWTSRAVRMLNEAKEKVRGIGNPPAQPKKPEQQQDEIKKDERPPIQFNDSEEGVPQMYLQQHALIAPSTPTLAQPTNDEATPAADSAEPPTTTTDIPRTLHEMRQRQNAVRPEPAEYLFYQAPLHYYLSPLDIRILRAAFTSYQSFPSSILPRVERVSNGHVVDDELRKRIKYLAHLPYGCEVGFLECDWTDTVSSQVLDGFKDMLERRRKRHDEKEAREEKERVRIERLGDKEMAQIRRTRRVPSHGEDPTLGLEWEALPASTTYAYDTSGSGTEGASTASPPWPNRTTSGFASLASPSTSPTAHRTVWGTTAIAPASPELQATQLLPSDNEFRQRDDGWLQGWERDLMDEDLAAGMADVSLAGSSRDIPAAALAASGNAGGGGKKGKKGKKITLMSTTARRGA